MIRNPCAQTELRKLDDQQGRYVAAIAQAGEIDALVIALKTCDQDRQRVQRELAALDGRDRLSTFDVKRIERDLANRLAEWRGLLKRQTPIARQVLSKLLADKIVWTPRKDRKDEGLYEFAGRARFDRTLAGIVDTVGRESPYRYQNKSSSVAHRLQSTRQRREPQITLRRQRSRTITAVCIQLLHEAEEFWSWPTVVAPVLPVI